MPRPKLRTDELRARLITEAMTLLHSEGRAAVTARRVATNAGTSTAAVYELFGSKTGLVRSIFFEGFERLADRLDAVTLGGDVRQELAALLDTTREFALDHPMLFEVMFARPFVEFEPTADDQETAKRIYARIVDAVAALLGTDRRAQSTVDAAHVLVALNSGLITAELNGLLGGSPDTVERRRTLALEAALTGLHGNGGTTA